MAVHGSIGEFNPRLEDWTCYTERLESYFLANGIGTDAAEQRRAILLSLCGPTTYQLIRNLIAPDKPTDKTFAQLVKLVKDHHHPRPSSIVARKNFHEHTCKPEESVSDFIAELRKLSEHCNFGDTLNQMLLDRLVCGCNDRRLQGKLLAESDLTFDKAFTLATAYESAVRGTKQIESSSPTLQVISAPRKFQKKSQRPKNPSSSCFHCGGNHSPTGCRFKEVNCNYCGKQGHIAKVCFSRERDQHRKPKQFRKKRESTHQLLSTEQTDEQTQSEYTMYRASSISPATKSLQVVVRVNSTDVKMEVDTGATLSVISEETYKSLWPNPHSAPILSHTHALPCLKTYTGESIKVKGQLEVNVSYNDQQKKLNLLVTEGNGPSLMGRDWLQHLRLDWPRFFPG